MENMKRMICAVTCLLVALTAGGQWKWDGGAGDSSWTSAANWYPDGVPATGDDVLLDHSFLNMDYEVRLPSGTIAVSLDSLILRPAPGKSIRLVIPSTNKAVPALNITGTGESLSIDSGAVLVNASGAAAGEPIQLAGWLRISDGGRYVHATARANARLIDRLSTAPGTSTGIFEFDVPGTAGYTVSLTGNTFGSLVFRSAAAGGLKSYSGSGSSELYIRGDLVVDTGAGLTSTLTANIRLDGHLLVRGLLSLQPPTAGSSGRSLILSSPKTGIFEGANIQWHAYFREMVIGPGHQTLMKSNLNIPHPGQNLRVLEKGTLSMGVLAVHGAGSLELNADAMLRVGHPAGIRADGTDGSIRTASRKLHKGSRFIFDGAGDQQTGDGMPDTIAEMGTDKASGALFLTRSTQLTSSLGLVQGRIITSNNSVLDFSGDTISHHPNEFGMDSCGWASSFVDGPLRRRSDKRGRLVMPIGKDGIFRPLTLSRTGSGLVSFLVTYSNGATPATNTPVDPHIYSVDDSGYWIIQMEKMMGDSSFLPELPWKYYGDSLSRKRWLDSLRILTSDPGFSNGWKISGSRMNIRDNGTAGTLMSDLPISSSCLMTLGKTGAPANLPITEIKLTARKVGTSTKLEWETSGVSQKTRFVVERTSEHGRTENIGILTVTNTRNKDRFSLSDEHPSPGWNTYKVCANEVYQESHKCSGTVAVHHPARSEFILFPVPASEHLQWKLSQKPDPGWIRILNNEGAEIWKERTNGRYHGTVDVNDWSTGMYHLILPVNGTFIRRSFLKGD
jgi:hypothetical protein